MVNTGDHNPDKCYEDANEFLINDNYEASLNLYTRALGLLDNSETQKRFNCLVGRSQAYLKLEKIHEALVDSQNALDLNRTDYRAYLRKGIALFKFKNYVDSLGTFEKGQTLIENESSTTKGVFADWITKCNQKIAETLPVPQAVYKYDWYQTESDVVVSILAKNFTSKDINITNTDQELNIEGTNPDLKLKFMFQLCRPIKSDQILIKYMANKIEIKLRKTEAVQWPKLEAVPNEGLKLPLPLINTLPTGDIHKPSYPSSSRHAKNWDKVEMEINKEDKEGLLDNEDALNKLFKQVYSNGSEETRKAMNKSFTESGGTVLSTNWGDIGKGKVDMKPPDGMEFKKWD